jgi:hypothetical protein
MWYSNLVTEKIASKGETVWNKRGDATMPNPTYGQKDMRGGTRVGE